jgi:2-C-methyl-D-erythritol 4-phosphate cytidylyltransferase
MSDAANEFRFWAVVPAAGRARRMGETALPKQYLQLAGSTVIEWALMSLLSHSACAGIVVALAADDQRWQTLSVASHPKVRTAVGGVERVDSVRAGLRQLGNELEDDAWILVHDAARPCLSAVDLDGLIVALRDHEVGGLLVAQVVDTLKRVDARGHVIETVARDALWRALTPQMFRRGVLQRALQGAADRAIGVTDESQAVELLGLQPKAVPGSGDNLKITVPDDLVRAEQLLSARLG